MIDAVYKTVQVVLNKNNYGVLTPDRFNVLAEDAQLKIISELPDDLRRARNRVNTERGYKGVMDAVRQVENTLDIFTEHSVIQREADGTSPTGFSDFINLPSDLAIIYEILYKNCAVVEELKRGCSGYIKCNSFLQDSYEYPTFERRGSKIYTQPDDLGITAGAPPTLNDDVTITYQRLPKKPKWTFTVLNNQPVFNPSDVNYQDFELPEFWFDRLVVDICGLAGVHLREELVVQYINAKDTEMFQRKNLS